MKLSLSFVSAALAGIFLASCCGRGPQQTDVSAPEPLPKDAIAFHYNGGHLYFDATVCDSLPARLVFDTGATGLYVDSLWLTQS